MNKPKENKVQQVSVKRVPGTNKIVKIAHPEMEEALRMWLERAGVNFSNIYEVHYER